MEAFVLVGCLLSFPIIYYATRPYAPPSKSYKPHSDMEDVHEEPPVDTEEQQRKSYEDARKRQERLLSQLNPSERERFLEYIEASRDPVKRKELAKMQKLDCLMVTALMGAVVVGGYLIVTHW